LDRGNLFARFPWLTLADVPLLREVPPHIRSANGPEFVAPAVAIHCCFK
jgi:hypothetical protein